MTLHVIHTLRARGHRQRQGQHGLAAPDHERREPRRVRGAARGRGAARPPARELRLGHVRRRQHGRRDGVHGDARARARAAPRGLRRRTASGSASTSTRTPRTRSRPCGGRCCSGGSSTASRRRSTATRCARRRQAKDAVRAYELVYAALGGVSAPPARDDRDPAGRGGARRARSTAGCSGSRSATCCRSSTRPRFIWYRVGGDLELHLMLIDEAPAGQAALLPRRRRRPRRAPARGSRQAGVETRDATELVGRPRFTCRDPFGNLVELAHIDCRDDRGARRPRRRHERRQGRRDRRRTARCSRARRRATRSRRRSRAGPSRSPRTGGAPPRRCARGCPTGRSGSRGQMHGLVVLGERRRRCCGRRSSGTTAAPAPSAREIEARVGLDRLIALTGNRALAGFTAPKLLWLRRHEPGRLRADPARAAAEGLRPLPADRRARDRRRRRVGDAALRRRATAAGRRRSARRSRSRSSGCRRRTSRPRSPARATRPPRALGVGHRPARRRSRSCSAPPASSSPSLPALRARPRGARARLLPRRARAPGTRWA